LRTSLFLSGTRLEIAMTPVRCLALFVAVLAPVAAEAASVPNTFSANTAAKASEVNANFTALVNAVTTLEQKVAALENGQTASAGIAGTYDLFEVFVDVDQNNGENYGVAGATMTGSITFNNNGSGSGSSTESYRQLAISESNISVSGQTVKQTDVRLNENNNTESFSFTWTQSGNTVTVDADVDQVFVRAGNLLIGRLVGEGRNGLSILVRRP
jgi:hypothetical protein